MGKATFCSPGLPEDLQSEILRPSLAESCTNVTFIIKSRKYDFCNPRAGKCKSLLTKSAKNNFPTIIRPPNPRESVGKTKFLSPVLPEDRRSSRVLLQLTEKAKNHILSPEIQKPSFCYPKVRKCSIFLMNGTGNRFLHAKSSSKPSEFHWEKQRFAALGSQRTSKVRY